MIFIVKTEINQIITFKEFPAKFILFLIISIVTVFALDNPDSSLLGKLDKLNPKVRQTLIKQYSDNNREFNKRYTLTADIRFFNLRIGRLELGEVIISDRDSFSITYDPPFEKWDTRYLSYWLNDSVFVDEVVSQKPEKYIYVNSDNVWTFLAYNAEAPRELKQAIFQKGLKTNALNLIEFTRLLYRRQFSEIREVLFLAETYPIRLEKSPVQSNLYSIYNLKWDVHEGEERVRLHGVHLVGLETDTHLIPVAGILKVSFVGLLDVDLIGVIQFNFNTETHGADTKITE